MLTGFVASWLKSQYDDERDALRDELSRIYDESFSQVVDSLLFNRVVEPALKDSVTITMVGDERLGNADNKPDSRRNSAAIFTKSDTCTPTFVAVTMPDSLKHLSQSDGSTYSFSSKKQNLLIRSVKLFINHSDTAFAGKGKFSGFLPGNPDSQLFKKVYNERIGKKKLGVTVRWMKDTVNNGKEGEKDSESVKNIKNSESAEDGEKGKNNESVKNGVSVMSVPSVQGVRGTNRVITVLNDKKFKNKGLRFESAFPGQLPGVEIRKTFPYLIGRITTQILFALILLLLTGSAFFFTNKSLNRQLMLNSLRNDFVSNITHELKTPVSTVKVALEALKTFDKVNNPAITREYLDMAGQEMNRLDQLISKVLDQSMIGEQKQVIQPQMTNIKELTGEVLLTLQPRLTARNATIRMEDTASPGEVYVDPLHYQGVITNLIDNSLKYGNENPVIQIRLWQEKGSAIIEVSDNGPGIPKEYLGRVFDKFFRVPSGDTHNIKGYGLGLSFAALVMKEHGGSISVRNLTPAGCAFTLKFPIKSA